MTDQSTSTELVDTTSETHLATSGGGFMAAPRTFQDLKEMAKYMAKGELMVGHSVRGNPGDCMAVIMQAERQIDMIALEDSTFLRIGGREYLSVVQSDGQVAFDLLQTVAEHLTGAAELIREAGIEAPAELQIKAATIDASTNRPNRPKPS